MEIQIITNHNQWNTWFNKAENSPFQQSWEWGEILIAEGKTVERLAVVENGEVLLLAQITYQSLPLSSKYAYAAAGPVFAKNQESGMKNQGYESLCEHLKKQGCTFFRLEPLHAIQDTKYQIQKSLDLTPSTTSVLDLRKPFDTLLATMHKNTRYSIRQAESKGVVVKQEKKFDIFWTLMRKTSERNKLRLHGKRHYEIILENKNCAQLTAYKDSTPIATAVFWHFGDTLTYLFAASDYEFHDLQAPYLIQKCAIELAKSLGCTQYDFFGIAPRTCHPDPFASLRAGSTGGISVQSNETEISRGVAPRNDSKGYDYDRTHKYAGITKFKLGFGGEVVSTPGTFDVVLKKNAYRLYNLLRKIRRLA